ncbi:MAG: VOC family protein [Phycisphaerales bacterium]
MAESTTTPSPNMATTGSICWHELMTTDQKAAIDFYKKLLGWETQDMDMGPAGIYKLLMHDGVMFGGCMEMTGPGWEEAPPPHWMTYLAVDDVDASVEKLKDLGGSVFHGPLDIPNVGRFAVVNDPQGGHFTLFHGNEPGPLGTAVVWNELVTTDREAAVAFYTALIGWTTDEMDMGPTGVYTMFKNGETYVGGCMTMPPEVAAHNVPPHWMGYIGVDNLATHVERAQKLGATTLTPIIEIPNNHGSFCTIKDPTGAVISLHQGAA